MEARHIMSSPTICISPGATVRQAIETMLLNRVSGLPVIDADGSLAGVVSEGDLMRRSEIGTERQRPAWLEFLLGPGRSAEEYVHSHSRRIVDVMTEDAISVEETTPVEEIVKLMEKRGIKRVPVLREGRIVGIVTRADLLRAFLNACEKPPAAPATDEEIRQIIYDEIDAQKWAPQGSIQVKVRDGRVTLSGTIFDERERHALRVCAENAPGVTSVTDELVWVDPASGTFMSPAV